MVSGVLSLGRRWQILLRGGPVCRVVSVSIGRVSREAVVLPDAAVEFVGAGLRGHVHHAARGASEFGRVVIRDNTVLLHCINRNIFADAFAEDRDVFHAVQQNLSPRLALSVDGIADAAVSKVLAAVGAAGGIIAAADVAGKTDKVIRVARQAGQLLHLLRIDNLRQLLGLRIHFHAALGNHLHLYNAGAKGEFHVKRYVSAYCHFHFRGVWLEAPGGHRHHIVAWRQAGQKERAG